MITVGKKNRICHYILLLGLGLHTLILIYNVYKVLQVQCIWVVEISLYNDWKMS